MNDSNPPAGVESDATPPPGKPNKSARTAVASTDPGSALAAPAPAPTEFPLSLDEFCQRASLTERRVILLSAFHYIQRRAGCLTATESEYRAAFAAFVRAPV